MTEASAIAGNDVATLPDYPAEIRAPAGSLAGISGFQLHFSSENIHTPGDACDVLVVMNPAALKVNIDNLKPNGILIVNANNFAPRNLKLAGYESNPIEDGSLTQFQVFPVELTRLTRAALKDTDLSQREVDRCKNFFAVGMVFWLYNRPMDNTLRFIKERYAKKPPAATSTPPTTDPGSAATETAPRPIPVPERAQPCPPSSIPESHTVRVMYHWGPIPIPG